ncbi:MAG: hypothetical protein AB3N23_06730 [Paracoccaceae bacterium]
MRILSLAMSLAVLGSTAQAEVMGGRIMDQSGAGQFVKLDTDAPFAVGFDTFDDDNLYAFDEQQGVMLVEPVRIDISPCRHRMIPAGTEVSSHYVFFDSLSGIQVGYVDFDAPVLGIAAFQNTMAATDYLADTNITYISEELRGLEEGDYVWIDENEPSRLWVYWAGSSPGDYIRVFTQFRGNAHMM